jgi:hypothetical protein
MDSANPTVGLWADPGVPRRVATRIADDLAEQISEASGSRWQVELAEGELPLAPDGTIPVLTRAPQLLEEHGWQFLLYLTDLPRYTQDHPVVCELSADARVALISLPPLGAIGIARRTRQLATEVIMAFLESRPADASSIEAAVGDLTVEQTLSESGEVTITAAVDRLSSPRMLSGMLRSNRPGSLLPALTGCIAVAVASGAFGIFYGTLATVADPLSIPRQLLITVLVLGLLTAWLIIRNQLWSRRDHAAQMWQSRLDNTSTIITVGASVTLLYLILFVVMLVLALAVIHPSFLRSEVMHPVGLRDYLGLAWLTASMGTLAGALGSNFDSADAVREATYSRRYHQRRELFDTYEERQPRD